MDKERFAHLYQPENASAFAHNLANLYEAYGKVVSAFLEAGKKENDSPALPTEHGDAVKVLSEVAESWMKDPHRAVSLQSKLWKGYIGLWSNSFKRMMGDPTEAVATPDPRDGRFKDPEWSRNIFFDFCKQLYLLTVQWAQEAVEDAENLDEETKQKARFYIKQISAALSPSNFVLTNPELLHETLVSNGENLVRGMTMLAEDLKRGKGELKLRQTDEKQFVLGKNIASTKGKVIFQNDLIQLIQYEPTTAKVMKRPMLIVPPWINKFYILDLSPEKSFIKWMVDQGMTVFCISWVNPNAKHAKKSFEEYMIDGILKAADVVSKISGEKQINVMGYCVGGTLLAATLAYLASIRKKPFASATLLTTQVDFTHAGDLKIFTDEEQIKHVESLMEKSGFLDGSYMATTFNMLRSTDLIWPYVVNNYLKGKQPEAFDLLYWNSDATRLARANHSYYLRQCYLHNALAKGKMILKGKKLELKKINLPIYDLATKEDHIAPAKSVFIGSKLFGGDVTYVLSGSGHIAGVINPPAKHKYEFWTNQKKPKTLEEWTKSAKKTQGSWWPHWLAWLQAQNKTKVAARKIGKGRFKPIENAPGSYVKEKS